MLRGGWKLIGIAAFAAAAAAGQQSPVSPQFEVVSIRPVPANADPIMREANFTPVLPGGRYSDVRASLFGMVAFAYNVKNPATQMVGLPKWAQTQSYSVEAKPAEGFPALSPAANREQVRLMLKAMLEDRFQLQVHTETRQERLFEMAVAKGGIKIKTVDPPDGTATVQPLGAAMGDDGGRMIGKKSTMADIARCLTIFLKHPVVDRTGLSGYYDIDIQWKALDTGSGQAPGRGFGAEGIALLLSNLESQLGLKLTNTTGPVDFWVVDRVEQPSGN